MFRLTTLTLFFFSAGSAAANTVQDGAGAIEILSKFRHWVEEHGKKYESEAEEIMRMKIWASNHGELNSTKRRGGLLKVIVRFGVSAVPRFL